MTFTMAKKIDTRISAHPADHHRYIAIDTASRVSLKDLRKSARQTQDNMATALAVGQDTISRLEKRSDMLLSTLRHYVECVGGQLALVATFPDQPAVIIDPLGEKKKKTRKHSRNRTAAEHGEP